MTKEQLQLDLDNLLAKIKKEQTSITNVRYLMKLYSEKNKIIRQLQDIEQAEKSSNKP